MRPARIHSVIAALTLCSLLLSGCSGFNRAWQRAGGAGTSEDGLTGRWEGTWRSEVNGHADRLRCLVTPLTNGWHSARFHAKYRKGILRFSFGHTAPLVASRTNGGFSFKGEADLGWYAGGVYRYEGKATGTNFFSTYDSKYDRGVFQMERPAAGR